MEAWYIQKSDEDQRLPHHCNPKQYVSLDKLRELGILYWHLNPQDYENDEELRKIRENRGYNYMVILSRSLSRAFSQYVNQHRPLEQAAASLARAALARSARSKRPLELLPAPAPRSSIARSSKLCIAHSNERCISRASLPLASASHARPLLCRLCRSSLHHPSASSARLCITPRHPSHARSLEGPLEHLRSASPAPALRRPLPLCVARSLEHQHPASSARTSACTLVSHARRSRAGSCIACSSNRSSACSSILSSPASPLL
ncbi:1-2-dihydroxy-3-keto-5-methylthiopentene dioxygenase 1 [Nymphaea thermarum]|nr:1-2-dihydroxy-3-keto-5-methylthiopentene dioxygenase 1 [Nymphaea thermarum]